MVHVSHADQSDLRFVHPFIAQHPQTGKLHEVPSIVSKQQLLEIYDPVKVEPVQLVLLWDPVSEFRYTYTLQVSNTVVVLLAYPTQLYAGILQVSKIVVV